MQLLVEKTLKEKKNYKKVNQAEYGELEGNNRLIFTLNCMSRKRSLRDKKYKCRVISEIITMFIP